MLCFSHCVHYCAFQVCKFCIITCINILHFLNWLTLPKLRGLDSFLFTCFKNKLTTRPKKKKDSFTVWIGFNYLNIDLLVQIMLLLLQTGEGLWQVLWHTWQSHTVLHDPRAYIKTICMDTTQVSLRHLHLYPIPILRTLNPTFCLSESTYPQRVSYLGYACICENSKARFPSYIKRKSHTNSHFPSSWSSIVISLPHQLSICTQK